MHLNQKIDNRFLFLVLVHIASEIGWIACKKILSTLTLLGLFCIQLLAPFIYVCVCLCVCVCVCVFMFVCSCVCVCVCQEEGGSTLGGGRGLYFCSLSLAFLYIKSDFPGNVCRIATTDWR